MSDGLRDAPDDGSDKPLGYLSEDGELEVRESVDADGKPFHGYHETELGQHQRWMRQAPDLFELYQAAIKPSPIARMETIGRVGFTISICCGPCGSTSFGWSVQVMTRDGREFDQPFAARDFAHAVEIAELEIAKRGWQ